MTEDTPSGAPLGIVPHISSHGFEYGVKHFYNPKSGPITEILFDALRIPPADALDLLKLGAVYVDHRRQMQNEVCSENRLFRVHTRPRRYGCAHPWRELVVFEDRDFVVLNKPSGIPSHPSVDNAVENSLTQTAGALRTPLLITHRLDTLTSGLIVYGKNSRFVKHFNSQLQQKTIEKKYVALTEPGPQLPARLIHYMEPNPRSPKKLSDVFTEGWALCELEIPEQKRIAGYNWLKINLLTGRTHQIRSQLAHLQAPILGDALYGSRVAYRPGAIALRACELSFNWESRRLQFRLPEELDPPAPA